MTGIDVLVAVSIAVGLVGVVVPLLPGALLVWSAIVVWGFSVGTATGWAVVGVATALIAAGQIVKYTIPGRRLRTDGVPNRSLVVGGMVAIVGFFVVPVVDVHRLRPWHLRIGGPAGRRTDGVAFDPGSIARRWCFDAARVDLGSVGRCRVDHRGIRHLNRARSREGAEGLTPPWIECRRTPGTRRCHHKPADYGSRSPAAQASTSRPNRRSRVSGRFASLIQKERILR